MRKPISSLTHGVLDYLTVATFATLPKVLGFSPRLTTAMQTLALGKLCYVLMTDHELGVVRKIPMKAHLAMDAAGGAALAALPFVLDEDDETAIATCVALGLFDIAAAPMTQTTPTDRRLPARAARNTGSAIAGATRSVRQYVGA
jgi:hypothetical protein